MVADTVDVEENYVISVFCHLLKSVYVGKQVPSFILDLVGKTYISSSDNVTAPAFVALEITAYALISRTDARL